MNTPYDMIVLGTGGIGSAALLAAARRGLRVLGLDRFPAGHDRGSSHGQTRIIRQAYFEHPDYVPLLKAAYEGWAALEQAIGQPLISRVGLLEVGPADGIVVPGVLASAQRHQLDVQTLTAREAEREFPGFRVPEPLMAVFERDAGFLPVEHCVRVHLQEATRAGAELRCDETIVGWNAGEADVVVQTLRNAYRAARLVIAAGPWSATLLADLRLPLRVVRKHLHWMATAQPAHRADGGCPTFFYEVDGGYFYGFPALDAEGLKMAEHSGGKTVADPLVDDRLVDPADRQRVADFASRYLPAAEGRFTGHAVCFYTMTPDEHFVVDRHPRFPNVAFAAGLSGHGFKFAPVLGRVLCELACDGQTELPIGFLAASRAALASSHRPGADS